MNCSDCQELLQQYLDGTPLAERALFDQHVAACPECREWHAAAQRLTTGLRLLVAPAPPSGLTARIISGVLADRHARQRFRRQLTVGAALAASLLLVALAGYFWTRTGDVNPTPSGTNPPVANNQPVETPAPPSLRDSVAEVGSAVASVTRRTAGDTVEQARQWLPAVPTPALSESSVLEQTLDPPARSLREAGQGVSAGFEPVTSSARRALDLFLREIPPMESDGKSL